MNVFSNKNINVHVVKLKMLGRLDRFNNSWTFKQLAWFKSLHVNKLKLLKVLRTAFKGKLFPASKHSRTAQS